MAEPTEERRCAPRVSPPRPSLSVGLACAVAALAALLPPACLERRDVTAVDPDVARCTSCHGDSGRDGDYLLRSAPPYDLSRQTLPGYPGVGAHQIHLNASSTHAALPCNECHVVPESVDAPGHADDAAPGDVTFGALAQQGGRSPVYAAVTRSCTDSYCHAAAWPVWSEPRDSSDACGSCHGLPPPAPHPQYQQCSACHGEIVDAERQFIAPERHVDGVIDYAVGDCQSCHGSADNAAPPLDTAGNADVTALGVGAHQTHLLGTARSRPVACVECHLVPVATLDPGHLDSTAPAELVFSGVALAQGAVPRYEQGSCSATSCHGDVFPGGHPSGGSHTAPLWTVVDGTQAACGTCHGLPPPPPHPNPTFPCHQCHANIGEDDLTFVRPELHVDGIVTFQLE